MNLIVIIGNIGQMPELKQFPNGQMCQFSVCVNESYKDRNQEWQKMSTWFNCKIYGNRAVHFANKAQKGDRVSVKGKFRVDDKEEGKRYTYIMVEDCELLTKPQNDDKPKENNGLRGNPQPTDDLPF